MMRFFIAGFFLFSFLFVGCSKDKDKTSEIEYEYVDIHDYAREHFPGVDSMENGMYVIVHYEGSGSKPVRDEVLYAYYTGHLLTGQGFDTIKHRRFSSADYPVPLKPVKPSDDATDEEKEEYDKELAEFQAKVIAYEKLKDENFKLFQFRYETGNVIQGWHLGFGLLTKGSRATFLIPSHLAYGDRRVGVIPPNSPLRFDVELVNPK
ncbi:FKBP-type peptidyl-prolyl cis-trans isomerase [Alkalitalea saponilacus]|uniref:Peptidyl-prolyl cis-trans isomerase n=1 Tax=Alkalitalea saponilacus TaxID=889453 RepID=A0A1T5D8K0_9BACT|nr:FKBP-type peptidyl-prolyl cis-trans isomerase [Alkalitalea saponilacus]ASB50614.1 hypothetical protein CDL62_16410 [Alkalitalea saponilacus]SKB67830.1 FKBP-type peptidyl-prolyl cis-trans isomerase [Alkalitalea saponilacus]